MTYSHEREGEVLCVSCFLSEVGTVPYVEIEDALEIMRERNICAFCGEWGSHPETLRPDRLSATAWRVLQCDECHGLSSSKRFRSFGEKRSFIRKKLARRYDHVVGAREWDRSEVEEMGPGLRPSVVVGEQARKIVASRLEFDFVWLVSNTRDE